MSQFSHARGAFCVTRELGEYVRKRLSADAPVRITGNGVRAEVTDLAVFDEGPRSALGISRDGTVITFLGFLQPWHGVDLLMKVLACLPDTYLWVIGNGSERSRLEALARSLDLENRVYWFGHHHGVELQALLNASDIGAGSLALHRNDSLNSRWNFLCGSLVTAHSIMINSITTVDNQYFSRSSYLL